MGAKQSSKNSFLRFARLAGGCAGLWLLAGGVPAALASGSGKADWLPDPPEVKRFTWADKPCEGCRPLAPRPEWRAMAALAGAGEIRYMMAASDESNGEAWSAAPNMVVLSPSALTRSDCQVAFLVGHELVHIARRHFDEDAHELMVLSGKPASWTHDGNRVMALLDGSFSLALRMSSTWQQQEWEADWIGSLLAAQAYGCSLEKGALSYFGEDGGYGGGLAAAHDTHAKRMALLLPFAESARRLARRQY